MKTKKRVAVVVTEYWDISHADVFITKMMEGFSIDGIRYQSTLEIASLYVDRFPENDISRSLAKKHNIPMFDTIEDALLCGGNEFTLDGIIIIGEHGDYPSNEYGQVLYPRRQMFERCLNVMLEHGRIVPLFSDKGFAVTTEDIIWVYDQVKRHSLPFMSSSSIPFCFQYPAPLPIPSGAPLHKMFGFIFGKNALERYGYHTLEMMQSVAERRAYGESGIRSVHTHDGEAALAKLFSAEWADMYRTLGGFVNLDDTDRFPYTLEAPVFVEVNYVDGLKSGMFFVSDRIDEFVSCYQVHEDSPIVPVGFKTQWRRPYVHANIFVLELERFIHTGRPLFPVERSLLTTGATDAMMRSLYYKQEIETPHLNVRY